MKINEVFYSICGEGHRVGTPSVFVRFSGCSARVACWASGIRCDTEFDSYADTTVDELLRRMSDVSGGKRVPVVWTGGEPMDQLTPTLIGATRDAGWTYHALETSGARLVSQDMRAALGWISLSPKVSDAVLKKNFNGITVDELRFVIRAGQPLPCPVVPSAHLYLSPHDGPLPADTIDNAAHCVGLCLSRPEWKLSTQQHKTLGIK